MMFSLRPSRTKNVPTMDAKMHAPPISSGNSMPAVGSALNWIVASSMVATSVTA